MTHKLKEKGETCLRLAVVNPSSLLLIIDRCTILSALVNLLETKHSVAARMISEGRAILDGQKAIAGFRLMRIFEISDLMYMSVFRKGRHSTINRAGIGGT